jgi:hypothetical protein
MCGNSRSRTLSSLTKPVCKKIRIHIKHHTYLAAPAHPCYHYFQPNIVGGGISCEYFQIVLGPVNTSKIGTHKFSKNQGATQTSRCQEGERKKLPHQGPTNIMHHNTKRSHPGTWNLCFSVPRYLSITPMIL